MEYRAINYADRNNMIAKNQFTPYKNESDVLQFGDMTIENRLDRITIYGNIDITKDKEGLEHALLLKQVIDTTIKELENTEELPDRIVITDVETVDNPFA